MAKRQMRASLRLQTVLGAIALMAGIFMFSPTATTSAASPGPTISLMIDGKGIETEVTPRIVQRRMLVPLRAVAENTGVDVEYAASTGRVTLKTPIHSTAVFVGKKTAYKDGKTFALDAAPVIVQGRTLVPIRFVSEALGYQVTWDAQAGVASVHTQQIELVTEDDDLYKDNPYVVKAGDSLSTIAKNHDTTVSDIKDNNTLKSQQLYVGQMIYLPEDADDSKNPLTKFVSEKRLLADENQFPISQENEKSPLLDTYGDGRTWGADAAGRNHEGIDIMADKGTPVYASSSGTINRIGWNTYGGWRINITDASGKYKLYYAHLDAYAPGLKYGTKVKAGQLIGFVGDSGYGSRGTEGKFAPHLHFGLYQASNDRPLNPFYYLKYWELNNRPV
ncbi:stalk domain-containing protein [Brevibacillus migulae]|uniref:stalk domain-containing protein n=1 Tax=Brevibacillus migulae TaxID=1644114 RepID=UPI001EEA8218|nr:stalk domain-containing protein [Brevibacillus migulae]